MRTTSAALATLASVVVALTLTTACSPEPAPAPPAVDAACVERGARQIESALERGRKAIADGHDVDPAKLRAIADRAGDLDTLCSVER